ncbi:MAG TPA: hypothetical protein VM100_08635, partial [Longimicrobiales bacterium]|nr:hypothetical protein [Longimicrobiales bacterium]
DFERTVWQSLQHMSSGEAAEISGLLQVADAQVTSALQALLQRRAVLCPANSRRYYSLSALLNLP